MKRLCEAVVNVCRNGLRPEVDERVSERQQQCCGLKGLSTPVELLRTGEDEKELELVEKTLEPFPAGNPPFADQFSRAGRAALYSRRR